MLKFIGLLLHSGELSVAVEGKNGFEERTFSCEPTAMEPLFEFVLNVLGPDEPAIQFVVAPIDMQETCPALFGVFADNDIGNAALDEEELDVFVARTGQQRSGRLVAEAFKAKHARLFRR